MALGTEDEIKEATLVSNDIQALADLILSPKEIEKIDELTPMFLLNDEARLEAQRRVLTLAPMRPKRPVYYAVSSLSRLPDEARHSMKYFGDYIDLRIKSLAMLVTEDERSYSRSLGKNLVTLSQILHSNELLLKMLKVYNEALYVPAKHDFELPDNRITHRFSTKEALITALITVHLAEMIAIEYGIQLASKLLQHTDRVSVSVILVDPEARVLFMRPSEEHHIFDVPFKISSSEATPHDNAYQISEELTLDRGRIIRCEGPYDRLVNTIAFKEIMYMIYSPSIGDEISRKGVWMDPLSISDSSYASPAKQEIDRFL